MGNVNLRASKENNQLIYKSERETIRIEPWGRDGLRVLIIPNGGGQTSDWALEITYRVYSCFCSVCE